MDPNQALDDMITAVVAGDFATAGRALSQIQEWRARGGFLPSDPREVK